MNYLEDNLDLPLREVLQIMQEQSFQNKYFGIGAIKCPLDFWIYQEIIIETKPDVIIEIGNYQGGPLLALAHICEGIGKGRVIGIDIDQKPISEKVKTHKLIRLLEGDACNLYPTVEALVKSVYKGNVLIIEDSAHTYSNTLRVLTTYSPLIKKGGYFIVEDSICRHGLEIGHKPGPYEAIEDFIKQNDSFKIDRNRERFLITWNPKGYLRRIK